MRTLSFVCVLPLALVPALACSSSAFPTEHVGKRIDPIINGYVDNDQNNDATVVIVENIGGGYAKDLCTGALIAKNVVVTARHCVSRTTENVDCQNDVLSDKNPSSLAVLRGWDALWNRQGYLGKGKIVIHDRSTSLCGHDIAFIVLDSADVTGPTANQNAIIPLKISVNQAVSVGEEFSAVGYGFTDASNDESAGKRHRRDGVRVTGFEEGSSDIDFVGTQSICNGDSGGPAISAANAVIGVTSRGANCYENHNVWTRTDKFKWLVDQAVTVAGTTYTDEDGAVHGGSTAASCTDGSCADGLSCVDAFHGRYCAEACDPANPSCPKGYQCAGSGFCVMNEQCAVPDDCAAGTVCVAHGSQYCAALCGANGSCPSGFACAAEQGVCAKSNNAGPPYDSSGSSGTCSYGSSRMYADAGWLALLLGVGLLSRRRRNP